MQESFFEKAIIDQQHLIVYASDPDTYEILYMTQAAASLCGLSAREAYGRRYYELIQGRNAPCPFCTNSKLKLDIPYRWEHYSERLQKWMNITDILVPFQGKNRRLESARDITEQKETFDRVSSRLSVEEALVNCIQTLSGETDVTMTIDRFLALIGRFYAADQTYIFEYGENITYNTFEWCAPGVSREIENLQEIPLEYIANQNDKFEHDGKFYIISLGQGLTVDSNECRIPYNRGIEGFSAAPLMKQGKVISFLGVDNPTESVENSSLLHSVYDFVLGEVGRRRLIEELERSSYTDLLTGMSNRNYYIKKLNQLSCSTLHTLDVIYVDVSGVKELNDNFGHEYGDRVIQNVTDILRARTESNAFRVGGDKFVVLCENTKQEDFQVLAESLHRDFKESRDFKVSASYTWKDRDISVDNEIMRADDLIYAQKQGYYHTILYDGGHTRTGIATEILREIADRRLVIYCQPQTSPKAGQIMGAETLVRKRGDPSRLIPPDQFIPYYECERVISHLDLHMFQTVCSDLREWTEQEVKTRISSDFSRMTLMASDIVQQLAQICRDYDVPTQQLTIEVTESIGKLETGQLLTLMRLLLGEGFSISLNDFDPQYSNLSILTMLEFNEIKFDKSLVEELGSNIKSRVVMKNTMQVYRELPKTCSLAEDIETIEQLELLRQCQHEYGQGYYFTRPVKVEAFLDLLRKEQALGTPALAGNNPPDGEQPDERSDGMD